MKTTGYEKDFHSAVAYPSSLSITAQTLMFSTFKNNTLIFQQHCNPIDVYSIVSLARIYLARPIPKLVNLELFSYIAIKTPEKPQARQLRKVWSLIGNKLPIFVLT